jgi:hypothetical protein
MPLPRDYVRPATEHPLVDAVTVEADFVRIKARMSLSGEFCGSFEEGAARLLDEVGPRPTTVPPGIESQQATVLIECDTEEPVLAGTHRGLIEFGVNSTELPAGVGLPLILALASYVSAYVYVREYQLIDIHLPDALLQSNQFPGPQHGPSFVQGSGDTRLGMVIKPRFPTDATFLRTIAIEAGRSGLDYVTDDELTVGSSRLPFAERVKVIVEALEDVAGSTGSRPAYIANVTGEAEGALERAFEAQELGVDGIMVNVFAMGHDVIARLATDDRFAKGIMATGLGLGVLTRGREFRTATELVVKLARLSGADAVYTGPFAGLIDSSQHSPAQFRRALTQPYARGCKRRPAAAVMSGGIGLPELVKNSSTYHGPLFLSMGYQLTEYLLGGISGPLVLECVRAISDAVREGGTSAGRRALELLAKKSDKHRKCLESIRAEEAVAS